MDPLVDVADQKRLNDAREGHIPRKKCYVRDFDQKWLRGGAPAEEALVGSGDIQSLADLLPVLPLTLTMISLGQLLEMLLKVVF